MGHGSDIQAIETEAKYNRTTKEFTIDTPSNNAVKLTTDSKAEYGTHALIQARLLCDGIQYGTHAFILPVRDPSANKRVDGVELGVTNVTSSLSTICYLKLHQ
jgi:acyl-CoA oxidase